MTTPSTLSGKDFQAPLLAALHALTGGKPAAVVKYRDTYGPIIQAMGIASLDTHGHNPDGKERVAQWIQYAHKNLKRTGLVLDMGRGQWALTPKGADEASKLTPVPLGAKASDATLISVADPAPSSVSTPVSQNSEQGSYHPDAYIRTVAAENTPCFGHYSHKSSVCGTCSLQGPCINFLAAELSRLAAVLKREDAEAMAKAQKPTAPVRPATSATATPATPSNATDFDWSGWDIANKRALIARAAGVCPVCQKTVKKNSKAVWVRANEAGPKKRKKALLFHPECGPQG